MIPEKMMPVKVRFGHGDAEEDHAAASSRRDQPVAAEPIQTDTFQPRNTATEAGGNEPAQFSDLPEVYIHVDATPAVPPMVLQAQNGHHAWQQQNRGVEMTQFIAANHGQVHHQHPQPRYLAIQPQEKREKPQDSFISAFGRHWKAFTALGFMIAALFGGEGYLIGNQTKSCPAPANNTPVPTPTSHTTASTTWACPTLPDPTSSFTTSTSVPSSISTPDNPAGGLNNTEPNHGDSGGLGSGGNSTGNIGTAGNSTHHNSTTEEKPGESVDSKSSMVALPPEPSQDATHPNTVMGGGGANDQTSQTTAPGIASENDKIDQDKQGHMSPDQMRQDGINGRAGKIQGSRAKRAAKHQAEG